MLMTLGNVAFSLALYYANIKGGKIVNGIYAIENSKVVVHVVLSLVFITYSFEPTIF